jgi:hypothetical protein
LEVLKRLEMLEERTAVFRAEVKQDHTQRNSFPNRARNEGQQVQYDRCRDTEIGEIGTIHEATKKETASHGDQQRGPTSSQHRELQQD